MSKSKRPKIKLIKSKTQRFLELATLVLILLAGVYILINYSSLPDKVPMHFNISGEVDSYGSKTTVWILFSVSAVLCFGLYKLNQYPDLFNYPIPITKENAKKQYTTATKIMTLINFLMSLVFAVIIYQVVSLGISGEDTTSKNSEYLIYIIVGLITIAPLVWIVKSSSDSDKIKS